jgi:aquaporin Z
VVWVAPLIGAAIAGQVFRGFGGAPEPAAVAPAAVSEDAANGDVDESGELDDSDELDESDELVASDDVAAADRAGVPAAKSDEAQDFFDGKRS